MTFDGATGELDWTPSYSDDSGNYEVKITDFNGQSDDEILMATVNNIDEGTFFIIDFEPNSIGQLLLRLSMRRIQTLMEIRMPMVM